MIADFFNENSSKFKASDLDIEDKLPISSSLVSAFYVFLDSDELDMIKYDNFWNDFKVSVCSEPYDDTISPTISELSNIDSTITFNKRLNTNLKIKYKSVQEYYELLQTTDAFEYSKDDEIFPVLTFSYLNVNNDLDLSKNTFFIDNINGWLQESLKEYVKNQNL